jgi:hypothetical protein
MLQGPKEVLHYIFGLQREKKAMSIAILWEWWNMRNKVNSKDQVGHTEILSSESEIRQMASHNFS